MTKNTNKRPALSSSVRFSYEQSELENLIGDPSQKSEVSSQWTVVRGQGTVVS